jgi:NAD(P)-dependent dehydrogenase (short-subunit alcohol dehydrogenase family)
MSRTAAAGGASAGRRVALVTGANRGLGKEIARQLAERGLVVVLGARDPRAGEAAAAELSTAGEIVPCVVDVDDFASIEAAGRFAVERFGRLDVLVNNAGAYYDTHQRAIDADLEIVRAAFATNTLGAWRMCQVAIPHMRRGGYGRIVNVSSGAGALSAAEPGTPAYRVSKAALNMVTVTLAAELGPHPILVNSCCPGWVKTRMGGDAAPLSVEQGADTPVWLATLPDGGPTGGFFRDREPIPW